MRVELAAVIHQAIETCLPALQSGQHPLTQSMPPQPVFLYADPVRLTQVFSNLLNNAVKYGDAGSSISLTVVPQGSEVLVSIKDSGIGIAPDMLSKVFEMFIQIDQSMERSRGGLGIGLTLVKELVELHGGAVSAFSQGLGRGSEFVVRLPLMAGTPQALAEQGVSAPETMRALRVLVIDDNRDSAKTLSELLDVLGNETRTAFDGEAGVEAAQAFRPELILLDIGMPKLNGYDAARRIRAQPWGRSMVLVALTGWGQEEDRSKSREAGFNHHLVKPVDFDELMQILSAPRLRATRVDAHVRRQVSLGPFRSRPQLVLPSTYKPRQLAPRTMIFPFHF